jgi:uroporphyrinogen decarboxylase
MAEQRFLAACRRRPTDATPVWFMRQAGRSLPGYRSLRDRYSLLELCRIPELAVRATLEPVHRYGVDAAILLSDIVVPLHAADVEVEIRDGIGPVVERPLRTEADVERLRGLDPPRDVPFVLDAVSSLRAELDVPLIGFAGGPFTLASYLVEGGPSRDHARTKALMYGAPDVWDRLMRRLAGIVTPLLRAEIESGAAAVQLFDSWAGTLDPMDYERYVLPFVQQIFDALEDLGAPRILFGVGTGELLELMAKSGADVVGVDWRVPLDDARARLGGGVAVQGNIDPAACLAPWRVLERKAGSVLQRGGGRAHVFNLGHGVLPGTDPDVLRRLTEFVHAWRPVD